MSNIQQHFASQDPIRILDDFLNSLPPLVRQQSTETTKETSPQNLGGSVDSSRTRLSYSSAAIFDDTVVQPPTSVTVPSAPSPEELRERILRVADFLYGNRGSLLESALGILDEQIRFCDDERRRDGDTRATGGGSPESGSKQRLSAMRILRARRSGRTVALVLSQRASKVDSERIGGNTANKKELHEEYYLCLLGRDRYVPCGSESNFGKTIRLSHRLQRKGMHCTCRSFFEQIKLSSLNATTNLASTSFYSRNGTPTRNYRTGSVAICKHLLAAIMAPYLLPGGREGVEEIVNDREFAMLVTQASIG